MFDEDQDIKAIRDGINAFCLNLLLNVSSKGSANKSPK
jgi:hypothetical protein